MLFSDGHSTIVSWPAMSDSVRYWTLSRRVKPSCFVHEIAVYHDTVEVRPRSPSPQIAALLFPKIYEGQNGGILTETRRISVTVQQADIHTIAPVNLANTG